MMFRKKFFGSVSAAAIVLTLAAVIACSYFRDNTAGQKNLSETSLFVMDTYCTISVQDGNAGDVSQLLYALDSSLDCYDAESDLSELNRGGVLPMDTQAAHVIQKSLALQRLYGGGVDITSGALTALWGITTENPHVPEQAALDAARKTVGAEHVQISGEAITLDTGTQIDLGAVAKGYGLDCVKELLDAQDASYGIISMTSSMLLYGAKPDGTPFTVAIRSPDGDGTLGTVTTDSCFLSTSGGYERFFTADDGTVYAHILHPESGYPVETDLTTVTVFCDNGLLSDYLSTQIYMGGTSLLEHHLHAEEYKLVAADTEGNLYVSDGLSFEPDSPDSKESEKTEEKQ